jgi:hypothetical protein
MQVEWRSEMDPATSKLLYDRASAYQQEEQ